MGNTNENQTKILGEIRDLLKQQNLTNKELLTFNEALVYMGVSKSFLYKLTHQEKISFSKPSGKLIYFKKSDLDNWMLQNKNEGINDLESQLDNYLKR